MRIFIPVEKIIVFKYIVIVFLLAVPFLGMAQTDPPPTINSILKGRVFDASNKDVLPGASVSIKGTTHGVITNNEGRFDFITGQKFPYTLIITFLGYEQQEVVANGSPVEIYLKPSSQLLNDVVVVGYGTKTRKDLISAISTVKAGEVKNNPVAGFDAQLQGKSTGLQINSNTGVPGDGVFVRVRGTTSINASNDPLYIVDGVFMNNTSLQTVSTGGRATSPIADINPGDIENIEVLKDASATAIYGSRGANGVVKPTLGVIWERFPKFVLGFIGASLLFSFVIGPTTIVAVKDSLKNLQGLWFALAFTSIGLETNFADLFNENSKKPLYAFLIAQTFNIFVTLGIASVLF